MDDYNAQLQANRRNAALETRIDKIDQNIEEIKSMLTKMNIKEAKVKPKG